MTRATFFKHFELLAGQPDAVAKMRELVLQLAVRGQLAEQSSKDEPARNLVERARKAWTERKIRDREKSEAQEPTHKLPAGWVWTCLDEIGDTNPRNEANDKLEVGFVPMKLISAGYGEPVSFEVKSWGEVKKGFTHFADSDVVLAKITPCFENGKSAVIPKLNNGIGAGTTELHVFRQYSGCVVPDYVLIFFKTPRFINEGVPRMTGSAGQKRVPRDYFANTPFPLPPLAEQRRIVAKVDELMALCDELEQRQQARQHARGQLQQSVLHHLLAAREPATFAAAWQRTRDHFHLLHDTPDAIPQLRQAILSLAVQGRLVPQAAKDKPAIADLLEIEDEKRAMIEARKLRPNLVSEIPKTKLLQYEIPESWRWFRLGDVAFFQEGPGIRNWQFKAQGIKLLNVQNIVDGKLALENTDRHISTEEFEKTYQHFAVEAGDILFASSGASWGKTAWFVDPGYKVMLNTSMVRLKFYSKRCDDSYLLLFLRSVFFKQQMEIQLAGIQPNFGSTHLGRVYVPLPPLAEQKRIVARVEELLRWCDTLEAQLHQTRTLGAHLLASTHHHLLN